MASLEEFIERNKHQIFVGYAKGDSLAPHIYKYILEKKLALAESKGVIANFIIAEGFQLDILDQARKKEGLTLCCISSDSISPQQVDKICKEHYFSQRKGLNAPDRDFFTAAYRNDTRNHILKSQTLLAQQQGTLYKKYRYNHEDFLLLFTHSRMMEAHISSAHYYNHLIIDM